MATTDNNRFVREWSEVSHNKCGFGCSSNAAALATGLRWFPIDKGGDFRRWYGNNFAIVNWKNNGKEIRENIVRKYPYLKGNPDFVAKNPGKYFQPGVTPCVREVAARIEWEPLGATEDGDGPIRS